MKRTLLVPIFALLISGLASGAPNTSDRPNEPADSPPARMAPSKVMTGDPARGEVLAKRWCADCHGTVGDAKANDVVPSFTAIAGNPIKTKDYLRGFLGKPHKPMPPLELSNQQIEDLVVYITSLKGTAR